MNYNFINQLIKNKEGVKLARFFNLQENYLDDLNCEKVQKPFGWLFRRQHQLIHLQTYENGEEVLKACLSILDEGDFVYPVIKIVINNCLSILYKEKGLRRTESLAKILVKFTKTSNDIKFCAFNVLYQLYFEMGKFELLENLLLISENTRKGKKDFYLHCLFEGMVFFFLDRFKESFRNLSIAFKSKKLKGFSAFPYFLSAILNGKIPKKSALAKYHCESLIVLVDNVKHGLIKQTNSNIKDLSGDLVMFNVFRPCYTYIPLIAFCNLIKRLYFIFSNDAKLEIEKIREATEMDPLEIFSLVTSAIDLDLIKGYVSVNKRVIVFSKVNPFPNEINL